MPEQGAAPSFEPGSKAIGTLDGVGLEPQPVRSERQMGQHRVVPVRVHRVALFENGESRARLVVLLVLDPLDARPSCTTTPHPVRFRVEPPASMDRVHVLIRIALLAALGAVGCSSVYWLLYVALPAIAALLISQKGSERYLADDGHGIARALRWLAGAYAYVWLLTDTFPTSESGMPVDLEIEAGGSPTTASAVLRLLSSLPALLLLAVLSLAAAFLWPIGALLILVHRRIPAAIADFFALKVRYQFRLVAYHLSLVDEYPSLEVRVTTLPHSDAV